jgi:hypothetical protein
MSLYEKVQCKIIIKTYGCNLALKTYRTQMFGITN